MAIDQNHLVYVRTVRGWSRKRDEVDPRPTARDFEVRDDPTVGVHRRRGDILDYAAAVRLTTRSPPGQETRRRR